MYEDQQLPVRDFMDDEAPILAEAGRASVRQSFATDELPIVLQCHDSERGGSIIKMADVGYVRPSEKAKGKIDICLRQYGKVHTVDFENERALEFACDLALAAYGEGLNMMVDIQAQPVPTLSQMRDVLVKFGLADPDKLPPPKKRQQQSHGGRGKNATTDIEIEKLQLGVH